MTQASRTSFALLGDIEFQISNAPRSFRFSESNTYAEHPKIEGKPGLQYTGESLKEIKMAFRWHYTWSSPATELQRLQNARTDKTVMPLIMGSGRFYGNYVIEGIDTAVIQSDEEGNLVQIDVDVELKETTAQPTTANRRVRIPAFIKRK